MSLYYIAMQGFSIMPIINRKALIFLDSQNKEYSLKGKTNYNLDLKSEKMQESVKICKKYYIKIRPWVGQSYYL